MAVVRTLGDESLFCLDCRENIDQDDLGTPPPGEYAQCPYCKSVRVVDLNDVADNPMWDERRMLRRIRVGV